MNYLTLRSIKGIPAVILIENDANRKKNVNHNIFPFYSLFIIITIFYCISLYVCVHSDYSAYLSHIIQPRQIVFDPPI